LNLRPSIDGDLIAWESNSSGNFDIFLYRLSDRQTFQVTTDPAPQFLNDVFGNKVAYVDLRNGNEDIHVANFNKVPIANAGSDETVHVGSLVTLDGTGSTDPDLNYPLSYAWTFAQLPAGSEAVLTNADAAKPSFTPDVMGDYVAQLVLKFRTPVAGLLA
jgi:beta propeller repeat protein